MNVADAGDVVALVKDLRPLFGARVACYLVHNGSHAHDVRPYLTAAETGAAIAAGLAAGAGMTVSMLPGLAVGWWRAAVPADGGGQPVSA